MVRVADSGPLRAVIPAEIQHDQVGVVAESPRFQETDSLEEGITGHARVDALQSSLRELGPQLCFYLVDETLVVQQAVAKSARIAQEKHAQLPRRLLEGNLVIFSQPLTVGDHATQRPRALGQRPIRSQPPEQLGIVLNNIGVVTPPI